MPVRRLLCCAAIVLGLGGVLTPADDHGTFVGTATDGTVVRDYGTVAATRTAPLALVLMDAASGAETPLQHSVGGTALALENGVVVGKGTGGRDHVAAHWRDRAAGAAGLTAREASAVNGAGTEVAGISVDGAGNGTATLWRCG